MANLCSIYAVRPLAGAGIEILWWMLIQSGRWFAPSRGRELKYPENAVSSISVAFAPSRGRELKFVTESLDFLLFSFAPSRGRELKLSTGRSPTSLPVVRPLAGAGIEIGGAGLRGWWYAFAPSRGRELKSC